MTHAVVQAPVSPSDLKARWLALADSGEALRFRDAATRLGVSEAELLASRCGDGVRRLAGPWTDLIHALPDLGTVMALTRNESAVHEKVGRYGKVSFFENTGLVLNHDIDLRIFLGHWHSGFAVTEEVRGETRRSLQFFDADGTAVQKVYVREADAADAFERLVDRHLHADQSPAQRVRPAAPPPADRPASAINSTDAKAKPV